MNGSDSLGTEVKSATILAIDDLPENLKVLSDAMKRHYPDCRFFTSVNGEDGLEIARHELPDLVLLDAKMPKMDGFEVCRQLKSDPATRHIPVLMISALMIQSEDRVFGLKSGADGYLCKPYSVGELVAQSNALLRIKKDEDLLRNNKQLLESQLELRTRELRSSEQRFRMMADTAPVLIWLADQEQQITFISQPWLEFAGRSLEDELGEGWIDRMHPDDTVRYRDAVNEAYNAQEPFQVELRLKRADGEYRWILNNGRPLFGDDGHFTGYIGSCVDITKTKQTKQQLQHVLAGIRCLLWYAMITRYPNGDLEWDIHVSNEDAAQQFLPLKRSPGQSYTDAWIEHKDPTQTNHSDWLSSEAIRAGMHRYNQVYRIEQEDGQRRWLYEDVHVEKIDEHKWKAVGVCTDITDRKRAEEEKETLSLVSRLFLASETLQSIYDELPKILSTNFEFPVAMIKLYDDKTDTIEFVAHYGLPADFSLPMRIPAKETISGMVVKNGKVIVENDITKQAEFKDIIKTESGLRSVICVPMKIGEKMIGTLTLADTRIRRVEHPSIETLQLIANYLAQAIERKHTEEKLRLTQYTMDHASDAAFWINADSRITYANEEASSRLGYTHAELLSMKIHEVDPLTGESDWLALWDEIKSRGVFTMETQHRKKNGDLIPVDLTFNLVVMHEKEFAFAFARDVSEKKDHEEALRLSEEQLRQSQKMQAVGRLAGGIAHDFNNLLTSILGFSRLIMDSVGKEHPVYADAEEISRAGERAAKLTKQLLTFSRKQMVQVMPIDTNSVVMEMDQLLRRTLGEDIELVTLLGDNLRNIEADVGLLEQVIMNLAVNARDAMPTGGKLTIETSSVQLDEDYCKNIVDLTAGEYVLISVRDTGSGMTQEVREHAFEPFFTTKEAGKGTGLGLSTVYGIVQQGGGHIELDSVAGRGTEFRIYSPVTERSAEELTEGEAALPRGKETILLVEDEDTVRRLTARVLSSLGYEILQARNGSEALLVCEEYEQNINLVLTDVVMPHMGGDELAQHLREIRPDLKIVFTSGFTDHAMIERGLEDRNVNLILKPYTTEHLSRTIRDVLDE